MKLIALLLTTRGVAAFVSPHKRLSLRRGAQKSPSLTSTILDVPFNDEFVEQKREEMKASSNDQFVEEKQEEMKEQFDWYKAWYPIVDVETLDTEKPHHSQLLGMDMVVWNDVGVKGGLFGPKKKRPKGAKRIMGTWRAFVDQCPHRKVPLSEGRVEDDGTLMCSYHGWRFDGPGSCVAIPQVSDADELSRIKANPRTSCNSFPTKVINGVLFVWPSSDKDAALESELTPVTHRAAEAGERVWEGPWNYRELTYGADFFWRTWWIQLTWMCLITTWQVIVTKTKACQWRR